MNLTRCDSGHFYDSDKYILCPICNETRFKTTEDTPSSFRGFPYSGFDDFRLAEEIGSGSDCKIYHVQKLTNYALKIIGWESQDTYNSALREYEIAKRLHQWDYFIHYEGCYEKENQVFLLQEMATPWPKYVKEHEVSVETILRSIRTLCDALSSMRFVGLLHTKVNPMCIFMKDGKVKLGGFDHVVPLKPGEKLKHGVFSLEYTSPELWTHNYCSGTEDIYSLGITMYYMFSGGRLPKHYIPRVPPKQKGPDQFSTMFINSELLEIIKKATAYLPTDRYSTPDELNEAIEGFMDSHEADMGETIWLAEEKFPDIDVEEYT